MLHPNPPCRRRADAVCACAARGSRSCTALPPAWQVAAKRQLLLEKLADVDEEVM